MIKYTEYKYHLAALFSVAVWGATFDAGAYSSAMFSVRK